MGVVWPRKDAERHLRRIARKHGIRVHWVKGRNWIHEAEAYEAARQISIPRPHNQRQYLVALHEMGHILGPMPNSSRGDWPGSPGTFLMAMEGAAWGWAVEHMDHDLALLVSSPEDFTASVGRCLASHAWNVADQSA